MVKNITIPCELCDIDNYGKFKISAENLNYLFPQNDNMKIPYENNILKLNPPKNNNFTFDENNLKTEPKNLINAKCNLTFTIKEYDFQNQKGDRLKGYSCAVVKICKVLKN